MLVTVTLCAFTLLSVGLLLWQFVAAMRFPLHQRGLGLSFAPAVTLLKPLKGGDEYTRSCLRSWFTQSYPGETQILFGVADEGDAVCEVVRELLKEFPARDAELVITSRSLGANAKVSNLVQLARRAKHEVICVSDADVRVPEDFFAQAVAPLRDAKVGLVNCFYRFANRSTLAMRWEAISVNADFWSQVLQSNTLKPQDFALGAVMVTRREDLAKIGGLEPLLDYLADDYQLGHRIVATGKRIELLPLVVECWDKPASFKEVWNHQLRWARTIRASQPVPYFFSILSNVTFWAILLALFGELGRFPPDSFVYSDRAPDWIATMDFFPRSIACYVASVAIALRAILAAALAMRLTQSREILGYWWLTPAKDLVHFGIWAASFLGNTVEWRGNKFRLASGGQLIRH